MSEPGATAVAARKTLRYHANGAGHQNCPPSAGRANGTGPAAPPLASPGRAHSHCRPSISHAVSAAATANVQFWKLPVQPFFHLVLSKGCL